MIGRGVLTTSSFIGSFFKPVSAQSDAQSCHIDPLTPIEKLDHLISLTQPYGLVSMRRYVRAGQSTVLDSHTGQVLTLLVLEVAFALAGMSHGDVSWVVSTPRSPVTASWLCS